MQQWRYKPSLVCLKACDVCDYLMNIVTLNICHICITPDSLIFGIQYYAFFIIEIRVTVSAIIFK